MDKLNNHENNKINKVELLEEEKKILLVNIINLFSNSTLNSYILEEYKSEKISTVNIMNRIRELGLMEIAEEFLPKVVRIPIPDYMTELKTSEYERFFRVFLKEAEKTIKNRTLKKS